MSEIATRNPTQELVEWVRTDERREQIAKALPEGMSIDRFERATATALLARPELAKADRASLYLAILEAAQTGVVPDGKKGVILVYKTKVKTDSGDKWIDRAQFLLMARGVRDQFAEYGWSARTGLVYENDEFHFDEGEGHVRHIPVRIGTERGEFQGAWAMVVHKDGRRREAVVMSKAEIDHVRDKYSRGNPAWNDSYPQMAEKTPLHRLAKKVGLDPKERAVMDFILDTEALAPGAAAEALYGPTGEVFTARVVSKFSEQPAGVMEVVPEFSHHQDSPGLSPADEATVDEPNSSGGGATGEEGETEAAETAKGADGTASSPPLLSDEDEMLALEAAEFVPPSGKYGPDRDGGPLSLAAIYALPDDEGRKYLRMLMKRLEGPQDYVDAVFAFCRVSMPGEYQQVLAEKALA